MILWLQTLTVEFDGNRSLKGYFSHRYHDLKTYTIFYQIALRYNKHYNNKSRYHRAIEIVAKHVYSITILNPQKSIGSSIKLCGREVPANVREWKRHVQRHLLAIYLRTSRFVTLPILCYCGSVKKWLLRRQICLLGYENVNKNLARNYYYNVCNIFSYLFVNTCPIYFTTLVYP